MDDITKKTEDTTPEAAETDDTAEGVEIMASVVNTEETPEVETPSTPPEPTASEELSPLESLLRLGLSEREAELVLNDREERKRIATQPSDSLPRMAHSPRLNISYGELMEMKEIFQGLSDTEINRLYNKVTK
ncbi:MAG: hypothetical protein IJW66_06355 [Clostridia bacterium]|nr:hypothetical protein [Clostridia bacterium]